VYFYVQKDKPGKIDPNPVTYDVERLNIGKAMDMKTGVFTAPIDGNYFFTFSCVSEDGGTLRVQLKVNDKLVGSGVAHELNNSATIQSMLTLVKGDKVTITNSLSDEDSEGIRDKPDRLFTHFTGMLLP